MPAPAPPLPIPRGPLSEAIITALRERPRPVCPVPDTNIDPRTDDDFQLALHVAYELHYRSFDGVADEWEWHPSLVAFTRELERSFEEALRADAGSMPLVDDLVVELPGFLDAYDGPSLSAHVMDHGTLPQLREFAIHRSAYQLKEADPHTWAIPRLRGAAKAAFVHIQSDEYGNGRASDMHSTLFEDTMRALGLDPTYGAYVDQLPGVTLATGNLITMLGLHRRLRGALVGHLAVFEMTSVVPMSRYSRALRRLGVRRSGRRFYDVHVEADAVHENIALNDLVGSFARQEPEQAGEVLFGARALMDVEARFAAHLLSSWQAGRSSLLARAEEGGLADIA
jgi:hypothetical protein